MFNVLMDNGFPLEFIFKVTAERIKKLIFKRQCPLENNNSVERDIEGTPYCFFNTPFVKSIANGLNNAVRNSNIKLSYSSHNNLRRFIKVHKDPLLNEQKNNVVYKILCKDCDASYVGQTKRLLKIRIDEHRNHIRKNTAQHSVITDHRLLGHEFDWENVKILDEEKNIRKRLMSEMIYIKRQRNGLNLQSDLDGFDCGYAPIVKKLSKL